MINLSTPTDIMFRELMADKEKSFYWLSKKMGGEKKYEKMRDELLLAAKRDKQNKISDVIEYRSANGNRWMTYECARYYKDANTSYTIPYAFCFYETLGSVGAFVPVKIGLSQETGEDAVLIFNSHFFYQMCERLNIGFRTPQMARAFHEFIPSLLMETYMDEGRMKLLVRLPGSIGFGFKMPGDAPVFEVRTFLKDTQLNSKQQKLTAHIRMHADKFAYEPADVTFTRLQNKIERGESLEEDIKVMKEKYSVMGVSEEEFQTAYAVNAAIVTAFDKMGIAKASDNAFWKKNNEINGKIIAEYIQTINNDNDHFLNLLEQCAKNLGIRNFDKQEAMNQLTSK